MAGGPLIVQSDRTVLLEVDHPQSGEARAALAPFAELEKAPEHVHTYRITPLALWNASAAGLDAESAVDALLRYSRYDLPQALLIDIVDTMGRYGRLILENDPIYGLVLRSTDPAVLAEVKRSKVGPLLGDVVGPDLVQIQPSVRGRLKQALIKIGWPADDRAGYVDGSAHAMSWGADTGFRIRDYQQMAADAFWAGGSGVVVLPCGAGKTVVGMAAMIKSQATTLILVTNTVSARQWRSEILARTDIRPEDIGEYSGEKKEIRPITIATYQVMISRKKGEFLHLDVFDVQDWGLIIYDEVHLLPAPVFRATADLQSRRRLGLTATLIREDGQETDVFTLIGPKRFDIPWKDLEAQGWIAPADCVEVRVTLTDAERMNYALADPDESYRIGSTARSKIAVVKKLIADHPDDLTLVIGQFIEQLEQLAHHLQAPIITGKTSTKERQVLYDRFRNGEIPVLVVSKVANFSIDLPDASVAIQVSGSFGSRQEEAQRLGRILRPKSNGRLARFYSVVSRDTNDQSFAANRQRFLAEQGYAYTIVDAQEILGSMIEFDAEAGTEIAEAEPGDGHPPGALDPET
jgi:DNA excision repair protein ERCC-3